MSRIKLLLDVVTEYRHETPRSGGVFFRLDGRFIHNYAIQ